MNWEVYRQGQDAWREYLDTMVRMNNPYPEGTDEWQSWNEGWNSLNLT